MHRFVICLSLVALALNCIHPSCRDFKGKFSTWNTDPCLCIGSKFSTTIYAHAALNWVHRISLRYQHKPDVLGHSLKEPLVAHPTGFHSLLLLKNSRHIKYMKEIRRHRHNPSHKGLQSLCCVPSPLSIEILIQLLSTGFISSNWNK